jgi:glycosyltransferase involved in cell wall biosynthesis
VKIGLVVPGFSTHEGDWCIPALLDLARGLGRRHQVHVFSLRYPHRRGDYSVYGARVHALGGGAGAGMKRLPLLAGALARVAAEARAGRFDVLHGIWADEPGAVAVAAGRLLGTPAVVSVAGGELVGLADIGYGGQLSRANRLLTRWALRSARRVAVGSRLLRQQVAARAGRSPALVPLGVDTARFYPDGQAKAGTRLVHVASLTPVKDQAVLLRSFARVVAVRPEVTLDIAGEGPLRASLEGLASSLGIADRVRFRGALAHDRLPDLYRAGDLFVLSSRHESQNLAALEAAACGTPAVGTAVGVLPELAPPQCLAPVGDAEALAEVVLRLLASPEERAALARAQLERVRRGFALSNTLERLLVLYEEARG